MTLRSLTSRGSKNKIVCLLTGLCITLITVLILTPASRNTRAPESHHSHSKLADEKHQSDWSHDKHSDGDDADDNLWSSSLLQLSVPPPAGHKDIFHNSDFIWNQVEGRSKQREMATNCRMSNCFNWTRCQLRGSDVLKIHIYPSDEEFDLKGHNHNIFKTSTTYAKILSVIKSSVHYEANASNACLFVPRFDTLSRDSLSPDFVKHLAYHFDPEDEGRNHLMFNLYSGTWPDYHELDFAGFNPGLSILVKASSSPRNFRPGFDISLPLFDKSHPEKSSAAAAGDGFAEAGEEAEGSAFRSRQRQQSLTNNADDDIGRRIFDQEPESEKRRTGSGEKRKALLVFKGKRYTYGIGSETRNSLHHLHNGNDVLIFTTCKHGKKWKEVKDERCEHDNAIYDSIDYQELMENSTFCLIPRGRRLGSYRFLEALSVGCIPVLLSNDWVKPFDEVIDWKQIVVDGDERQLFQLPEMLRSFDRNQIRRMRAMSLAVYDTYFSSVQQIVLTTIDILTDRIRSHLAKSAFSWNLVRTGICDASASDPTHATRQHRPRS
jgi:glucuronyl/N-acetylglucosaminyl transferase EXT1